MNPLKLTAVVAALFPLALGFAQDDSQDTVELDEYAVVEKVPDPLGIIPERPTSTLFATDRSVLELPRSVSMIEGDMLERYSVSTVDQFIGISPGTYTDNFFGVPGSIDIRGESSDTFFRGFRRVENTGSFVTPITATSRVEIVRGPPTPYYGGGKVGGFMNFIPKSARTETTKFIERPTGKVKMTYGTYDKKLLEVEAGAPLNIGRAAGFYIYGQLEDSDSFYRRVTYRNKLLQLATDIDLNNRWRIEFGGMYQDTSLPENEGWNRLTQELIDNGTYITGHPTDIIDDVNNNGRLDDADGVAALRLDNFVFSPLAGFTPRDSTAFTSTGTTTLSRRDVLSDTESYNDSENFTAYFDLIGDLSDNLEVKAQFFYDSIELSAYNTTGYNAFRDPTAIEGKLTFKHRWRLSDNITAKNVFGVAHRKYDALTQGTTATNYTGYDRRDLSVGPTVQDRFGNAFLGERSYFNNDYNEWTDTGVFFLSDTTLFDRIGIILGVRWDSFDVDITEMSEEKVALGGGFAFVNEVGQKFSSSDDAVTYNASINYTLETNNGWKFVPYLTYAESTYLEVNQSGTLDSSQIYNDIWLADSDLWEGGLKLTGFEGKLYIAFDVYQQNRTRFDANTLEIIGLHSTGYELEMRFAPNETWAFTFAGTWQKTEETPGGLGALQLLPATEFGLSFDQTFGGRYRSLTARLGIGPTYESPGQPDKVLSFYGSYTKEVGPGKLAVTLGATYAAEVASGTLQWVELPDYVLTNGSIFYTINHWTVGVSARNIFDERYFRAQAVFGDGLVFPGEGRTADLSLSYSW